MPVWGRVPDTTKLPRLEGNIGSTRVELTDADLQELNQVSSEIPVEGDRYPPDIERMTSR